MKINLPKSHRPINLNKWGAKVEIKHNPVWEHYIGDLLSEKDGFLTVRIKDRYYDKLSYDIKFPKALCRIFWSN